MKKPKIKVISTEKEHKEALAEIERLWEAKSGTPDHDALEVLALLVEDYERRTFPMEEPDPVAAIRFRLEQAGKEQKDLVPILGSRSRVSEVMNRKRSLTLRMIRRLFDELHIPMEALIPRQRRTQAHAR
jgi:HTH-type transcriptional regulator/antitoxin HigA